MKVLEINTVCGIRSTGRICTDIASILEREGHECRIAYGREIVPSQYQKYSYKMGSDIGVKIDALKTRFFDNAGFNSTHDTKKLICWIKSFSPDVVHLHNIHGYYINVKLLFNFLKEYGRPVVWTLHDCWAFTGHCTHFTMAGCDKWKTGCYACMQKSAYPSSVLIDNSKRNYQLKQELFTSLDNLTIVTPSKWLADMAKQSFLKKHKIITIPNGIDLAVFKPTEGNFREKYGLQNKKIILGAATSWPESKNLKMFSEIADKLDDSYRVVVVGVSPKESGQCSNKILVIPRTNSVEEMAEIYTSADVFANLGREETMGLTTVEAMACGTPVVTSNCTAVPEVVTQDSGIVVEDLTVENVIHAIERVLECNSFETFSTAIKYEKSQQYTKYIELYKALI